MIDADAMITWLLERCSYVTIEDTFRDLRRGIVVCKNEGCGKIVDHDDSYCWNCGEPQPATRAHKDPDRRFTVIASTHGLCYLTMDSGASWDAALASCFERLSKRES